LKLKAKTMSALIFAPDLDPFALISSRHYGIVRSKHSAADMPWCNNAARKTKTDPTQNASDSFFQCSHFSLTTTLGHAR
jgi:hypothetical protein